MSKTSTFCEFLELNHPEYYAEAKKTGLLSKVAHMMGNLPFTAKVLPLAVGTVLGAKGLETSQDIQLVTKKPAEVRRQAKTEKPQKPRGTDKGRFERPYGADA